MTRRAATARAAAAAAAAAVATIAGAPGLAHAETASARLGLLTGARFQLGDLGADYAYAWPWQTIGFEAALLPLENRERTLRFGPAWWTTITQYAASSATAVDATLATTEMGVGARLHWQVPLVTVPMTAHLQGGVELLRSSTPLMTDGQRSFVGGAVSAGIEVGLGDVQIGVAAQVSPIGAGPGAASLFLTVAFGRP